MSASKATRAARLLKTRQADADRARYRDDPCAFASEVLGVELTADQAAVLRDIAAGSLTSWRAAQKIGKSTVLAVAALWWAYTRPRALVVLTSGNAAQVRIVLWRELTRLYREAKVPLGGILNRAPDTGLVFEDGRLVVGLTAADHHRLAGYSGDELLFLVDEASGFDDALLEAVIGNLSGGGRVLLCGNPTRVTGLFARTHRERLTGWRLHHSSARNSPNVVAGRIVIRGLATVAGIAQIEQTFGIGSAAVAVRVDGDFPGEGADSVIGLALLEAAVARWSNAGLSASIAPLEVGVDPGRYGDDPSTIQGRRGLYALPCVELRGQSTIAVAAAVRDYCEKHAPSERPVVRVDSGGLGAGVVDALIAAKGPYTVVGVNASQSPRHPRFKNARAELHFAVRRWLERGGCLPPDDLRDGELLAARYSTDAALRIQIESKDDIKKRLKRSPDRADALALACYDESPLEDVGRRHEVFAQPGHIPRRYEGSPHGPGLAPLPEDRWRSDYPLVSRPLPKWQPGTRPVKRYGW